MECIQEKFKKYCNCTYEPCERENRCCECLHYHRMNGELPGCFFNKEFERTYDRSITNFIRMHKKQKRKIAALPILLPSNLPDIIIKQVHFLCKLLIIYLLNNFKLTKCCFTDKVYPHSCKVAVINKNCTWKKR